MIAALAGLLGCQLAGEVFVRALALPLPGPVAGLGLLFGILLMRGRHAERGAPAVPEALAAVCDGLLRNLSLLFIPAAVGVVQYLGVLRDHAGAIALAIGVSTALALVVTAATFRFVSRLHAFRRRSLAGDVEAAAGFEQEGPP